MQIEMKLASESHVPRFRAGVGTWRSGYMIQIRLPWRHRARPSATLHEIQACPEGQTCLYDATRAIPLRQPGIMGHELWEPSGRATLRAGHGVPWPGPAPGKYPSAGEPGSAPARDKSGRPAGETPRTVLEARD